MPTLTNANICKYVLHLRWLCLTCLRLATPSFAPLIAKPATGHRGQIVNRTATWAARGFCIILHRQNWSPAWILIQGVTSQLWHGIGFCFCMFLNMFWYFSDCKFVNNGCSQAMARRIAAAWSKSLPHMEEQAAVPCGSNWTRSFKLQGISRVSGGKFWWLNESLIFGMLMDFKGNYIDL